MNVNIQVIPNDQQRYPTVGDWWFDENGDIQIRVSKMSDSRYEMLVALHELAEVLMCKQDGVTVAEVDTFDTTFEGDGEPGDSPDAPYRKQHLIATGIEKILAASLGVDWKSYDDEVNNL